MSNQPLCPIHNRVMVCPCCTGSKGGKAKGPAKARTHKQAHQAAMARVAKQRAIKASQQAAPDQVGLK